MSPPLYCFQDETSRSIDGCQRLPGMCYKHSGLYVDHSRQWGLSVAEYEVHLSLRYRDEVWVCSVWRNDDRRLVYWVDAVVREKASFFWRGARFIGHQLLISLRWKCYESVTGETLIMFVVSLTALFGVASCVCFNIFIVARCLFVVN